MSQEEIKNKEGNEQIKELDQPIEKKVESQEDIEKQIVELNEKLESIKKKSLEKSEEQTARIDKTVSELNVGNGCVLFR